MESDSSDTEEPKPKVEESKNPTVPQYEVYEEQYGERLYSHPDDYDAYDQEFEEQQEPYNKASQHHYDKDYKGEYQLDKKRKKVKQEQPIVTKGEEQSVRQTR